MHYSIRDITVPIRASWEAQFPFQFKFQWYDELEFGSILKICRFLIRHFLPSS